MIDALLRRAFIVVECAILIGIVARVCWPTVMTDDEKMGLVVLFTTVVVWGYLFVTTVLMNDSDSRY